MNQKNPENTKKKTRISETKAYRVFKIVRSVLFTVVLVFLAVVMIITIFSRISGNNPSLFGYYIFRVSTGSMEPAYEIGDVILVKECDTNEINLGDVITYNGISGTFAGKIVTHRVVKAPFTKDGKTYLITKGDSNVLEDPKITSDQIIGKVENKLEWLKNLYSFFLTPWGLLTLIALIILAFFNEIVNFVKSVIGIGYKDEDKESVEEIIERYQREQLGKESEQNNEAKSEQSAESDNESMKEE